MFIKTHHIFAISFGWSATVASAFCFQEAANKYDVDVDLLKAIAYVESGMNPRVTGTNKNGTTDFGLMQINSSTLEGLKISPAQAMEPCANVHIGAYVLARNIQKGGGNWKSVGSYNTGSGSKRDDLRANYVRKVFTALQKRRNAQIKSPVTPEEAQASATPTMRVFE